MTNKTLTFNPQALWDFDKEYDNEYIAGSSLVLAGVDEVGRGPLVGNVVAACVVLDLSNPIIGIRDSKKLTALKREVFCEKIKEQCIAWAVGECTPKEIDEINILQATFLAMRRAIQKIQTAQSIKTIQQRPLQIGSLLVDGNHNIPNLNIPQKCIIKGDDTSASIAAASIIAKVTRDAQMELLHKQFPEYGFNSNKGYGSQKHLEAIRQYGYTEFHRKSFKVKALSQVSLFGE